MTAEVAIVNNQAVVLAADSAVTIGRERVWKHTNKLFSAGPANDIGIMVYNTGDFLGVPWEVIVKEFRRRCGRRSFDHLKDFAESFIEFLSHEHFANQKQERLSIHLIIIDIFENIRKNMKYENRTEFYEELPKKLEKEIETTITLADGLTNSLNISDFRKDFKISSKELAKDIFGYVPKAAMLRDLEQLVFEHVTHKSESEYSSGVVIAGYGRKEFFPNVKNFVVDGKWGNLTRVWETARSIDMNNSKSPNSAIFPFAQSDMARLFVEGVYPSYRTYLRSVLVGLLNNKSDSIIKEYVKTAEQIVESERQKKDNGQIVDEMLKDFRNFRGRTFIKPLLKTVAALPKEEMAFMAKAIVELTALRRKFTSKIETVGGAVDVAVISKGDGFVWIDRKHYFDKEINPDFSIRKALLISGVEDAALQTKANGGNRDEGDWKPSRRRGNQKRRGGGASDGQAHYEPDQGPPEAREDAAS